MNILLLGFPVLKHAFLECGHDVRTCTTDQTGDLWIPEFPVPAEQVIQALPCGWKPDLVLLMDESTEPMFLGLERLDIPLAWYTIDAHLHLDWHKAYTAVFDYVFVAQKDYVPEYAYDASRQVVQWLPLFCNPEKDRYAPLTKIYDLSFVGYLNPRWKPERSRLLEAIQERIPIHLTTGEYVSVFNRSKVVLNESAANDVNFRVFEALACGSFLLTEKVGNGFEELFQDRTHLAMYERENVDQIVELANFYASHDSEREAIAREGRARVLASHTTTHRAQTIVHTIRHADSQALVRQRQARLPDIYRQLDRVYDHAGKVYELVGSQYANSFLKSRDYFRTAAAYRNARVHVVQKLSEERSFARSNGP